MALGVDLLLFGHAITILLALNSPPGSTLAVVPTYWFLQVVSSGLVALGLFYKSD